MPWEIQEDGGKFCVVVSEGPKEGQVEKCYDSKEDAQELLAALYANVKERGEMAESHKWHYRADIQDLNPDALAQEAPVGEVKFVVSVFETPDTGVPHGARRRQVIDRGAFEPWIGRTDFSETPMGVYVDHGDAPSTGYLRSRLLIGQADELKETKAGLYVESRYNLQKLVAREAFSDLVTFPKLAQFSFSNRADERTYAGDDGFEHVAEFPTGAIELSQVGIGAQRGVHLVSARTETDGVTARQWNLEELPNKLRDAWMKENQGSWEAVVAECWASDDDGSRGFIIANSRDSGWLQVPWRSDAKGLVTFDREKEAAVEQTWKRKGSMSAIRTALLADADELFSEFLAIGDPAALARMRTALDRAAAPNPFVEFYADLFNG